MEKGEKRTRIATRESLEAVAGALIGPLPPGTEPEGATELSFQERIDELNAPMDEAVKRGQIAFDDEQLAYLRQQKFGDDGVTPYYGAFLADDIGEIGEELEEQPKSKNVVEVVCVPWSPHNEDYHVGVQEPPYGLFQKEVEAHYHAMSEALFAGNGIRSDQNMAEDKTPEAYSQKNNIFGVAMGKLARFLTKN